MKILLANPRGFCAGVDRAVEMVERALAQLSTPIYVRHEVVHNQFVVESLKKKGAIFVEDLNKVPSQSVLIFSAHGVSKKVRDEAIARDLHILDATCPLVTKVHMEVIRYSKLDRECILIGHAGHPEVEGTLGQYHSPKGGIYLIETVKQAEELNVKVPSKLAYVTQTTLSVDDTDQIILALRKRFPLIEAPAKADICYATQNRQQAIKKIAQQVEVILVVGSKTSSNSNRLRELAEREGCSAYLIDGAADIQQKWIKSAKAVGVTAGASAPESIVQEVLVQLKKWGADKIEECPGVKESLSFALPKALRLHEKAL